MNHECTVSYTKWKIMNFHQLLNNGSLAPSRYNTQHCEIESVGKKLTSHQDPPLQLIYGLLGLILLGLVMIPSVRKLFHVV